jgi:uncharacterized Zn finger protein
MGAEEFEKQSVRITHLTFRCDQCGTVWLVDVAERHSSQSRNVSGLSGGYNWRNRMGR